MSSRRTGVARKAGLSALLGIFLLAGGCQLVGRASAPSEPSGISLPGPSDPGIAGVFQGALYMDGGEITAALELIPDGRRDLRGIFQAVSGLEAEGTGHLDGREFSIELVYGGSCPGRMLLTGEWDPDTDSLSGVVRASYCTGPGEGTFRFFAN